MKKILVTTDASDYSRRALKTALDIARKFKAEVELLYVMQLPEMFGTVGYNYIISPELIEQNGEAALTATLEGIDLSDVPFTKKKIKGSPAKVILEEIKDQNIDLVVMGSHGYGAISAAFLGSVSQYVLHKATCSVLIVK